MIVAPDWDLPLEFMCNASDYDIEWSWDKREIKSCMISIMQVGP